VPNATFEPSADSRLIRSLIRNMAIGDLVTDAQISELVGKPYAQAQSAVYSAKHAMQRDYKIVIARVPKTGWRRLEDADILKASEKHSARIRGGARRGARELACADYGKLKPAEQLLATTKQTIFGLISSLASDDGLSRISPGFSPALQVGDLISGMKTAPNQK
jgi:hypothetical protein